MILSTRLVTNMEDKQCLEVIDRLLNRLLEKDIIINEHQIAHLVKCLTGIPDDVIKSKVRNGVLMTWLSKAVSKWEGNFNPHPAVLTFALNIAVFLSSDENTFLELHNQDIFQRFIKLIKKALKEMEATPNVGYVRLISAFLKHKSGCQWIISSGYWSEVVILTLSSQMNTDFAEAGYKFVAELIAKTVSLDLEFSVKVIFLITDPIIEFATSYNAHNANDYSLKDIESNVNLVNAVLNNILEERNVNTFETVLKILTKINFESHLENLILKISNEILSFPFNEILHVLHFYYTLTLVAKNKLSNYVEYETMMKLCWKCTRMFNHMSGKAPVHLFIKLCGISNLHCEKVGPLIPRIITKDKVITTFHEQISYLQIMPCIYFINTLIKSKDELREDNKAKMFRRILPQTYRFIVLLKNNLEVNFSAEDSTLALEYLMEKKYQCYTKPNKVMLLRILICNLEDISLVINLHPEKILQIPEKDALVLNLIKVVATFLKESDLNWQDISETMLLLQITVTILRFQPWQKDVFIYGLDLMEQAFIKHLTMNMALLTNQFEEQELLKDIFSLIIEKLFYDCWEVRQSAVKVIRAITQNINRDPGLADLLTNFNVPSLVSNMAFLDENTEVRTSSFKCLQEMVKTEELWNCLKENANFCNDLVQFLYDDPSRDVCSEVATLITSLYEHQIFLQTDLFTFYDVMSYAATEYPHKEVRTKALHFWRRVIDNNLTTQGMLDGEFPNMTFSKESRKIIVLNNAEIIKRLSKVLDDLNENGCLAVLASALEEDRDVAMSITKTFIEVLKKYKIVESVDNSLDTQVNFCENSNDSGICSKIFGRKKLSPKCFVKILNKHLFIVDNNKPLSPYQQIELLLEDILTNSKITEVN